ncbi:HAD family hydrolase [Altibacter sp. HG106]|uniref:HAD family hydrolase n=1 Tax=Altibacter sp. HG106 TaxID=3023937 RepID=UPI0023506C72|nr:HAD family hydrolase [Altibacter sp. HG106]MDC7993911.1 HAD family hydrolase [Altibacter sp. HG106]
MPYDSIKVIAFDADDTLWVNEPLFRDAEKRFCELMQDYLPSEACQERLFAVEMKNLPLYGYGIKPFVLSLIEAAITLSEGTVPLSVIQQLMDIGKEMLQAPVAVLEGIEPTLKALAPHYELVMATKGDLLDQERKLEKSGLASYFHHIEIVSDKTEAQYHKLVTQLDIRPEEFLMVGNSVKSDILPVLAIGAFAFHIPFHTTWAHEEVKEPVEHPNFQLLSNATQLKTILSQE